MDLKLKAKIALAVTALALLSPTITNAEANENFEQDERKLFYACDGGNRGLTADQKCVKEMDKVNKIYKLSTTSVEAKAYLYWMSSNWFMNNASPQETKEVADYFRSKDHLNLSALVEKYDKITGWGGREYSSGWTEESVAFDAADHSLKTSIYNTKDKEKPKSIMDAISILGLPEEIQAKVNGASSEDEKKLIILESLEDKYPAVYYQYASDEENMLIGGAPHNDGIVYVSDGPSNWDEVKQTQKAKLCEDIYGDGKTQICVDYERGLNYDGQTVQTGFNEASTALTKLREEEYAKNPNKEKPVLHKRWVVEEEAITALGGGDDKGKVEVTTTNPPTTQSQKQYIEDIKDSDLLKAIVRKSFSDGTCTKTSDEPASAISCVCDYNAAEEPNGRNPFCEAKAALSVMKEGQNSPFYGTDLASENSLYYIGEKYPDFLDGFIAQDDPSTNEYRKYYKTPDTEEYAKYKEQMEAPPSKIILPEQKGEDGGLDKGKAAAAVAGAAALVGAAYELLKNAKDEKDIEKAQQMMAEANQMMEDAKQNQATKELFKEDEPKIDRELIQEKIDPSKLQRVDRNDETLADGLYINQATGNIFRKQTFISKPKKEQQPPTGTWECHYPQVENPPEGTWECKYPAPNNPQEEIIPNEIGQAETHRPK